MKDDDNRNESTGRLANRQSGTIPKDIQSRSNVVLKASSIYYIVDDHQTGAPGTDETSEIRFIYGDGVTTAQIETYWSEKKGFGEGKCYEANRACALLRAIEDHDDDDVAFHCGCRGEQLHPYYFGGQSFEDILNLTECILQSKFDDNVEAYL